MASLRPETCFSPKSSLPCWLQSSWDNCGLPHQKRTCAGRSLPKEAQAGPLGNLVTVLLGALLKNDNKCTPVRPLSTHVSSLEWRRPLWLFWNFPCKTSLPFPATDLNGAGGQGCSALGPEGVGPGRVRASHFVM